MAADAGLISASVSRAISARLDTSDGRPYARTSEEDTMTSGDEFLSEEILGYGAYICARPAGDRDVRRAGAAITKTAERLGLRNEWEAAAPAERESFAFVRAERAIPADIADDDVARARWLIHVCSKRAESVTALCDAAAKALNDVAHLKILRGVIRPRNYTGAAMANWAYGRQVVQQPGPAMPNAFFVPMSKTPEWWGKSWMERHTYFLPRYDDAGRMVNEGHALATEAGIACLLRRTYKSETQPPAAGQYEFLTYFECADLAIPVFHQVCAALRDVKRNPEWRFVREGPTWQGRRVPTWDALFE